MRSKCHVCLCLTAAPLSSDLERGAGDAIWTLQLLPFKQAVEVRLVVNADSVPVDPVVMEEAAQAACRAVSHLEVRDRGARHT